jgi:hypothetical protein
VVYCHLLQLVLGGFVRHGIGPIKCGNWCCVDGEPRGYERPWDSLRHTAPAGESLIAAYAAATIEVHKLNCWQCYKNLISNCLIKGPLPCIYISKPFTISQTIAFRLT